MICTTRTTRFLQSLPGDDARHVLNTLMTVTIDPAADTPRVRKLRPNLWECRVTLAHRRQVRCMFGYRADREAVIVSALLKKDSGRHQLEIVWAARSLEVA